MLSCAPSNCPVHRAVAALSAGNLFQSFLKKRFASLITPHQMSNVLVFGGCGALGRAAVSAFRDAGHFVISVDFSPSETASRSIVISDEPWGVSLGKVEEAVTEDLNLVFCAAGGTMVVFGAFGPIFSHFSIY